MNEYKDDNKNKEYVMTDAVGRKHFFIAGENGITEGLISLIRYGENEIRSSDFHFYNPPFCERHPCDMKRCTSANRSTLLYWKCRAGTLQNPWR